MQGLQLKHILGSFNKEQQKELILRAAKNYNGIYPSFLVQYLKEHTLSDLESSKSPLLEIELKFYAQFFITPEEIKNILEKDENIKLTEEQTTILNKLKQLEDNQSQTAIEAILSELFLNSNNEFSLVESENITTTLGTEITGTSEQ